MNVETLLQQLRELQTTLEARLKEAPPPEKDTLRRAIFDLSNTIQRIETQALANLANGLEANQAELEEGIKALKSDLAQLGKVANVFEDINKIAGIIAKIV